eukprot:c25640_g1_i1 orf=530-1294(+)
MERRHVEAMRELGRQEVKVHFIDTRSGVRGLSPGLSHIDADYVLARTLQDEEMACSFFGFNKRINEYDNSPASSSSVSADNAYYRDGLDHNFGLYTGRRWQETNFDQLQTDEAFARSLQDVEDQEELVRMMSLTGLCEPVDARCEERNNTEDEVDPDNLSYEDLLALQEAVGSQSKGLSSEEIAELPVSKYKRKNRENELCVICHVEYAKGDGLISLPCKHPYHADCIKKWLEISKTCPVCGVQIDHCKPRKSR